MSSIIVVAIVGLAVCLCKCAFQFAVAESDKPECKVDAEDDKATKTTCYLCLSAVAEPDWDSGEHRRGCAGRNGDFLSGLPRPFPVECPKCGQKLRLWPERGPKVRRSSVQYFAKYKPTVFKHNAKIVWIFEIL